MGVLKELFDKSKAISTGNRRVDFALGPGAKEKKPEEPEEEKPRPAYRLVFGGQKSPKAI